MTPDDLGAGLLFLVIVLAIAAVGLIIDRFLIRRTGEDHLAQVLLTVGIAFVLGDVGLWIWGGDNLRVPVPMFLRGAVELPGGIVYPETSANVFGITQSWRGRRRESRP